MSPLLRLSLDNKAIMETSIATLVIQHHVKTGGAPQYEAWLKEIIPAAQHYTGHLGVNVIRPAEGSNTYTVVLRFDTHEHLREWAESDIRSGLIERVKPLLVTDEQKEIRTGLEYWFTPSGPGPAQKKAKPFKQFLVTLSAIFPLSVAVPWLLTPLFRLVPTLALPVVSNFLVSLIIVFLMVYLIMPRYTRLISRWLFS
jgi:antibiotic biosynthesis monooxygenase (ABM) superfamily enzyme